MSEEIWKCKTKFVLKIGDLCWVESSDGKKKIAKLSSKVVQDQGWVTEHIFKTNKGEIIRVPAPVRLFAIPANPIEVAREKLNGNV
jgi:hypothetical protein